MVTIAVDAMGGDKAPVPEVEGAVRAAREFGHRIVLVGDSAAIRRSNWRDMSTTNEGVTLAYSDE